MFQQIMHCFEIPLFALIFFAAFGVFFLQVVNLLKIMLLFLVLHFCLEYSALV